MLEEFGAASNTLSIIFTLVASGSTVLAFSFSILELTMVIGTVHTDTTFSRKKEVSFTFSTMTFISTFSTVGGTSNTKS